MGVGGGVEAGREPNGRAALVLLEREANAAERWLHASDSARRQQGQLLEALGYGPRTSRARVVASRTELELLAYQPPSAEGPAILLVPAPIKAAYIWDLAPEASAVRCCRAAGAQVYLVAWRRPLASDARLGLSAYAERALGACVQAIAEETGQRRIFLAGHSLGGTFAAIFASLEPDRVRGLIELEGPLAFGAGSIEAALARAPQLVNAELAGNAPGTLLDLASVCADPTTFVTEPWLDWLCSSASPAARALHCRVRRWTLDESPMARRLFEDVVQLYRDNHFAEGRLHIGGRLASPRAIVSPVLAVLDPRSRLVPRAAVEAYRSHTSSRDVQLIEYGGDVGAALQHVGVLVGPNAHARVWPQIERWIVARAG